MTARADIGKARRVVASARRAPFSTANRAAGAVPTYLAKEADREIASKRKLHMTRAEILKDNRQGKPQCLTIGAASGERCIRAVAHKGRHISQRQYFRAAGAVPTYLAKEADRELASKRKRCGVRFAGGLTCNNWSNHEGRHSYSMERAKR